MGVWIEIFTDNLNWDAIAVTPCVGVWIEIRMTAHSTMAVWVTPCVGVWIEIKCRELAEKLAERSLPAWECGLKSVDDAD